MLVAPFLSSRTRERLEEHGVGYIDLTGNVRVALDRPALFVHTRGAQRDPRREERPARTLKGAKAARIVRALCDFAPPAGVRELAERARTDPGYVSRVFTLLEKEDLIHREIRGPVTRVDWQALIRRWTEDYSLFGSNRAGSYLEPTADCDDIDPYARHRHTSRCSYALIYGSEARQADDYKSALW